MYGQGMGFSNWICDGNGFFSGGFMGMIFMVVFWLVIIGLAIKVIQLLFSTSSDRSESKSMSILKERYAAGEITKKEFDQMKQDLS